MAIGKAAMLSVSVHPGFILHIRDMSFSFHFPFRYVFFGCRCLNERRGHSTIVEATTFNLWPVVVQVDVLL